ncbi:hypothetical protein NPIL_653461, partial [Nephila pilipes]
FRTFALIFGLISFPLFLVFGDDSSEMQCETGPVFYGVASGKFRRINSKNCKDLPFGGDTFTGYGGVGKLTRFGSMLKCN